MACCLEIDSLLFICRLWYDVCCFNRCLFVFGVWYRVVVLCLRISKGFSPTMIRVGLVMLAGSILSSRSSTACCARHVYAASTVRCVLGGRGLLSSGRMEAAMSYPTPSTCRTPRPGASVACEWVGLRPGASVACEWVGLRPGASVKVVCVMRCDGYQALV